MKYSAFLKLVLTPLISIVAGSTLVMAAGQPNFVLIFADDLGYGDLGCYGHPSIKTPSLDRMAEQGVRFTSFYAAASVCTPSRAALMTGRLPVRSGMCSDRRRVLFPDSANGIPESEITIAEALKANGYTSACIGKWHLGHLKQYLPTQNGFDYYFGIPYSNDMDHVPGKPGGKNALRNPKIEYWNVPLVRNNEIIERPANQHTLTKRYTAEAVKFIKNNNDKPFFLYMAHTFPHIPLFASDKFDGKSMRGIFGDVVEEIDWSVGRILETLRNEGLGENTLVIFTSDNGPWLTQDEFGGSAGLLRGGKGSTWEGGMREPAIAWWPGKIPPNSVIRKMASTLDVFPTILSLAEVSPPNDRIIDGTDISSMLFNPGSEPKRDLMFFYRGERVFAVRKGAYKAHFITQKGYGAGPQKHDPPLLFNLEVDPSEQYNIAEKNPGVIDDIVEELAKHKNALKPGKTQLDERIR
ncbi:MAG: sulfatase [Verrucomicrobia bacterium]|nr:sulfatase [Verrucomicrobiota bacterium]